MSRKIILVAALGILFVMFFLSMEEMEDLFKNDAKLYFFEHGLDDTGSSNLITAILLDYRLFDSLFEAGILLVAVSGVIWISRHDFEERNAHFMLDKYKTPELFVTLSRFVFPLLLMLGFFIILNGHLTPGGGFQGGAVVATAILILYFIDKNKETDIKRIVTIEKVLYLAIILVALLSLFTRSTAFTNFVAPAAGRQWQVVYLVTLNVLIGLKVAFGLWTIFTAFLKEGR